eukprot:3218579-Rhodomonas_salina.1
MPRGRVQDTCAARHMELAPSHATRVAMHKPDQTARGCAFTPDTCRQAQTRPNCPGLRLHTRHVSLCTNPTKMPG